MLQLGAISADIPDAVCQCVHLLVGTANHLGSKCDHIASKASKVFRTLGWLLFTIAHSVFARMLDIYVCMFILFELIVTVLPAWVTYMFVSYILQLGVPFCVLLQGRGYILVHLFCFDVIDCYFYMLSTEQSCV